MSPRHVWPFLLASCTVAIDGEQEERDRAAAASRSYETAFAARELPPLRGDADVAAWIAHAERSNGELEAAWHQWIAALEQVPQAASQDTTAMLGLEHTFDGGSALDRTALSLATDAMNNLIWPGRLEARGEAALARARAAAAEFDRTRLRLQSDVAAAYWEVAQRDEDVRLQQQLQAALAVAVPSLRARVSAGAASQTDLLAAEVALLEAQSELAALQASRPSLVAALRARAGAPDGEDPRPALPALVPLRDAEREVVTQALQRNPDVALRAREHEAALRTVTEQEWLRVPEFSLSGLLMGDGVATVGGAVTLPFLRSTAINAAVRQAEALARAAEALRRQAGSDAVAAVLAELASLDAAAQQGALLGQVLPKLVQATEVAQASWAAGAATFDGWAAAIAMRVDVERKLAQLRRDAATGRARLQALVGVAQ